MTRLVALDKLAHRQLRISVPHGIAPVSRVNAVSVVPREFGRLLSHFPLFYMKAPDSGQFEPVAVLGFNRGENLFLVNDLWDSSYVPLQIQRQPFAFLPRPAGRPDAQPTLDLALDLDSPYVRGDTGERLFQDDGQPTRTLQSYNDMVGALLSGSREAFAFTGRLAELNLLEPVRVDIEFADKSKTQMEGLYWIAQPVLKALPAATLGELRDREFLEWIYFQMASLGHLSGLIARKNKLIAGATA